MNSVVIAGFFVGLASSFHCIGMCGPISMALPLNRKSAFHMLGGLLANNLGRIVTYSLLGYILGWVGFSIALYKVLQWSSMFVGAFLIVLAWKREWIQKLEYRSGILQHFVMGKMGTLLASKNAFRLFGLGVLNGLLPCGIVFLGLATAITSGSPTTSALTMAAFGLGTFPGMILVGYMASRFSQSLQLAFRKSFPVVLTLVGMFTILRGANLGIPMISPKIIETTSTAHVAGKDAKTYQIICHGGTETPQKND